MHNFLIQLVVPVLLQHDGIFVVFYFLGRKDIHDNGCKQLG